MRKILKTIKQIFRRRQQRRAWDELPSLIKWGTLDEAGEMGEEFGVIGADNELLDFSGKMHITDEK